MAFCKDPRHPILIGSVERTMKCTNDHNERMAKLTFASVYPHYLAKVEKKGRSKEELHQVIRWLTGYNEQAIQKLINSNTTFKQLFRDAKLNPNARFITDMICGYRIEEIENSLARQIRYMDKLVDELAQGRAMEKIFRAD